MAHFLLSYFLFSISRLKFTKREENSEAKMKFILLVLSALVAVQGDVYMHNPRGSNNRLNEQSANRNNANRVFDSQVSIKYSFNIASCTPWEENVLMR